MNLTDIFKLMPLMAAIQKMIATAQKYMNDPEVMKTINLIKEIEADPDYLSLANRAKHDQLIVERRHLIEELNPEPMG